MAQAIPDGTTTDRNEPNVEQSNRQGQQGQAQEMTEHRTFQVKAMFFKVAEHLFNPHSADIKSQTHLQTGQISSQAPRFFFSDFPMDQQVDRINFLGGSGILFPANCFAQAFGYDYRTFANYFAR